MLRGVTPFWNWKTALNSGPYRGVPFAVATWRNGMVECAGGALTQMLLFSALAGVTGLLVQRLRNHEPRWRAGVVLLCFVPLAIHSIEWLVHETLHPGGHRAGISVCWMQSAVLMAAQWGLMWRGLFLAGEAGLTYAQDFRVVAELLSRLLRCPI